jgi:hypothetical protein
MEKIETIVSQIRRESSERNLCPMELIANFTILQVAGQNNVEREDELERI